MKLTKRLLALFLILAAWLNLTGCNAQVDVTITDDSTTTSAVTTTTASAADSTADSTTNSTTTAESTTASSGAPTASRSTEGSVTTTTTTVTVTTTTAVGSAPSSTTTVTTTTRPTTTATTVSAADKALVDRAFGLAQGEKIENATLTGIVTDSDGYSAGYGNATFHLQVEGTGEVKTIYCYRVKPADAAYPEVAVGDRLSLTGTIQNYKGTIEFYPAEYAHLGGGGTTATTASTTRPTGVHAIDEDGIYDSKDDVALYLHVYGRLPKNFVTKSEYNSLGKPANKCCGGDRFYNKEGLLPNKSGRLYYECDIDTYGIKSRGAKRIVYSNDGLIYYTGDHYASFTLLYGEP